MKKLSIAVTAAILTSTVFGASPRKADALQWQLEVRWGGQLGSNPYKTLIGIPASYRTVPWHPDDDYGPRHSTTIKDDTLDPTRPKMMNYTFTTGVVIKERLTLRGGLGFALGGNNGLSPGNSGQIRSVDIGSGVFERGYGKSLVYDGIKIENWSRKMPYFAPEIEVRLGAVGLLAGAWQKDYRYIVERGYDRYDALDRLDQLPLASVRVYSPYVGIRFAYMEYVDNDPSLAGIFAGPVFTFGPTYTRTRFEPAALGTSYTGTGRGWMVGLSIAFGGPVKRVGRDPGYK